MEIGLWVTLAGQQNPRVTGCWSSIVSQASDLGGMFVPVVLFDVTTIVPKASFC